MSQIPSRLQSTEGDVGRLAFEQGCGGGCNRLVDDSALTGFRTKA